MRQKLWAALTVPLLAMPVAAMADSISPASAGASLAVGGSYTVSKTVTVSTTAPTSTKVDVFFLADTTGSMGSAISSVRTGASAIMSAVSGLGDVRFAVGEYKDFPTYPWGDSSDYPYRLNQAMTASTTAVQAGINAWSAGGGADGPESGLEGMRRAASDAATGWRAGSERILVWFGDYPSHDSADTPGYPVSKAAALAALNAGSIQVEALSVGANQLNSDGDATYITSNTGGHLYTGVPSSSVAAQIQAAITTAFSTYSNVGLDLSEVPAGVTAGAVPTSYSGSFDRSVERSFGFDLTFTGVTPGTYDFSVYGTVDGGRIATETDRIIVGGAVPEPASLLLLGLGLLGLAIRRARVA